MELFGDYKKLGLRKAILKTINFITVLTTAYMTWKLVGFYFNNESPIVVVLTGSMEPAFYRGDLLFISWDEKKPVEVGEIVVFQLEQKQIPIVHRVVKVHTENNTNKEWVLTKGDNNNVDDRGLYDPGMMWLEKHHLRGRIHGHMPYIGMATIALNDYPQLKYGLIGLMALYALLFEDEK